MCREVLGPCIRSGQPGHRLLVLGSEIETMQHSSIPCQMYSSVTRRFSTAYIRVLICAVDQVFTYILSREFETWMHTKKGFCSSKQ